MMIIEVCFVDYVPYWLVIILWWIGRLELVEVKYMEKLVKECIDKYSEEIIELYLKLRTIIYDSVSQQLDERLWAKLPSYYAGDAFVRLIPFKDHINIEAREILQHKEELNGYNITSKGMLQIYLNQNIPYDILLQIFKETLMG